MPHLSVWKFNKRWGYSHGCFSWNFIENFQNSYVKEQSHIHAVGTLEEFNGLLGDLVRNALNLVIHKICKFKAF